MADKPTETTEVAAPAVGAGEAPAPEAAAAERELAEKKEADPEGEATKDETKTADGKFPTLRVLDNGAFPVHAVTRESRLIECRIFMTVASVAPAESG